MPRFLHPNLKPAMKNSILFLLALVILPIPVFAEKEAKLENPLISIASFLEDATEVKSYREKRRISTETFVELSRQPDTIILDTRSKAAFEQKHLKGARHLNFSDITKSSLAKTIPSPETRVLIYCNNNFRNNSPAFASKKPGAALNIPTFITLYNYGYRNIYELGPLEDENDTILEFSGTTAPKTK